MNFYLAIIIMIVTFIIMCYIFTLWIRLSRCERAGDIKEIINDDFIKEFEEKELLEFEYKLEVKMTNKFLNYKRILIHYTQDGVNLVTHIDVIKFGDDIYYSEPYVKSLIALLCNFIIVNFIEDGESYE